MNNRLALMMTAVLGLVAGCNGNPAEKANATESANTNASANAASGAPSSAPATGSALTQASLVGSWGQANCTNMMTFNADGTAESTSAEQANNRWTLEGSTIVITAPGEPEIRMPATLKNGELHLTGGGGEGASTVLTRCEAEAGAAKSGSTERGNEAADEAAE